MAETITFEYLREYRKCPDNVQYKSLDVWRRSLWSQALGAQHHEHLTDEIYAKWFTLRYQNLRIGDELRTLVEQLRADYYIGLITNGTSRCQWEKINELGLRPLFDMILVSGDVDVEKPNVEIFEQACAYFDLRPQQCCMIGDSLRNDIGGGQQARLGLTIRKLVNDAELDLPTTVDANTSICADFVIETIADLKTIFACYY